MNRLDTKEQDALRRARQIKIKDYMYSLMYLFPEIFILLLVQSAVCLGLIWAFIGGM